MSHKALYFPYISVPNNSWLSQTILYYDSIASIVPGSFQRDQSKLEPFMQELVNHELVELFDPMANLQGLSNMRTPFMNMITGDDFHLAERVQNFKSSDGIQSRISSEKFDADLFYSLTEAGLAERTDREWFNVESTTATLLMTYLAFIVGKELNRMPVTDMQFSDQFVQVSKSGLTVDQQSKLVDTRRNQILQNLMPSLSEIDLHKIVKFKKENKQDLFLFRTIVEQIALDPKYEQEELLNEKIRELIYHKELLMAKMHEVGGWKKIVLSSVFGVVGAATGFLTSGTGLMALLAIPGFGKAIHEVIYSEKPKDIYDQTGMKFLALMDRSIKL